MDRRETGRGGRKETKARKTERERKWTVSNRERNKETTKPSPAFLIC